MFVFLLGLSEFKSPNFARLRGFVLVYIQLIFRVGWFFNADNQSIGKEKEKISEEEE